MGAGQNGAVYDAAGNLHRYTNTGALYVYDAEGRLVHLSNPTTNYTYDGLGRRAQGPHYEYLYDLAGNPVTLLDISNDADDADEIFVGNRHVATYLNTVTPTTTYFVHADHLGTERVRTDYQGNTCQTTTNWPFGDQQSNPTHACSDPDGRTIGGMENDSESTLEHTLFRKYFSTPGRWMTPDPAGTMVADVTNPQSWNRYAYALNSPISLVDRFGLDKCVWDDGTDLDPGDYGYENDVECALAGGNWIPGINNSVDVSGVGAYVPLIFSPTQISGTIPLIVANNCGAPTGQITSIITTTVTTSKPTISAGSMIGGWIGGEPGAFLGAIIGGMFGVGGTASYVPSTKGFYAGPAVTFSPAYMGGSGSSAAMLFVPSTQNPDSIAGAWDYSVAFQPLPTFGATVVKSPGSGPPVVGPSVGTRIPVSFGGSYSFTVKKGGC